MNKDQTDQLLELLSSIDRTLPHPIDFQDTIGRLVAAVDQNTAAMNDQARALDSNTSAMHALESAIWQIRNQ